MYFQTLVKNLPGGISVLRYMPDGGITPEYISEGFAALVGMTVKETEELYREDSFAGVPSGGRGVHSQRAGRASQQRRRTLRTFNPLQTKRRELHVGENSYFPSNRFGWDPAALLYVYRH